MSPLTRSLLPIAGSLLAAAASAQSALFTLDGPGSAGGFGYAIAGPGDMNGDGVPDLVVAAPYYSSPAAAPTQVYAHAGGTGLPLWSASGSGVFALAPAGDIDHDGRGDVVAGSYYSGSASIHSGSDGAVLKSASGPLALAFGLAVAGGADLNADGTPDWVVGAPYLQGMATVYSGASGGVLHAFVGPEYKASFGAALALGDFDTDGVPDLLVGMPYRLADPVAPHKPGRVLAYSGATAALLFDRSHAASIDYFGASLAVLDDADGDGVPEYAVGAPFDHDAGIQTGEIAIFSGASGTQLGAHVGAHTYDRLGWSASNAGDVNGDGRSDVIAGTDFLTPGPGSYASLLSGSNGSHLMELPAPSAQAKTYGRSVSSLGDVTGDGLPELAVGDPYANASAGAVSIVSAFPHGVHPYGLGTSGCAGPQVLTSDATPKIGSSGFHLRANHAPAGGVGLAYVSSVQDVAGSPDPFGLAVLLHIGVLPPAATYSWLLVADVQGIATKLLPLPADPALAGLGVHAQAFWLWPSGTCAALPMGISSSSGLTITLQP